MNLKEFTNVSAKKLNESLAQKFGQKINLEAFTTEQLLDVRNKLRTKLFNVETTESFDTVQKEDYQKSKLFLDVLNAAIAERDDTIVDALDEAVGKITVIVEEGGKLYRRTQAIDYTYAQKREQEYPHVKDQLDMIYKDQLNGTTTWKDAITAIKNKYPKE